MSIFIRRNLLSINIPAIGTIDIAYLLAALVLIVEIYLLFKKYKNERVSAKNILISVLCALSVPAFIIGIHLGILLLWDLSICIFVLCTSKLNEGKKGAKIDDECFDVAIILLCISIYLFKTGHWFWGLVFVFMFIILLIISATITVAKAAWNVIKIVVHVLITPDTIRQQVRFKCPAAVKAEIQKEKRNCVECGIRDKNNKKITEMTIESDYGVSEEVYVGQVITV